MTINESLYEKIKCYNMKNNRIIEIINEIIEESDYIYHGTSKGVALKIQKDGYMKPNKTGEKYPSISFTNNLVFFK